MFDDLPDWYGPGHQHIWLPYAQMKTVSLPLPVARTDGSSIELTDGRRLIDGVAAWWTACHGYNHPYIAQRVREQLETLPHIMFGGLTHEPALRLARRLCALLGPGLDRVFFTESGSVSVEVAIKIAFQYWINRGDCRRTKILAFKHGYHGDTIGTMALCDPETGMHGRFQGFLAQHEIADLPCDAQTTAVLNRFLEHHAHDIAAIVVEPLVQGAGGMRFHSPAALRTLREMADRHGLLLVFDEIFTGFGRTGTMFAFEHAGIKPDIITVSKALTGGTLPLAATIASERIFEAFWSDDPRHALMHGPTFMANPLACAAANASLDLFEREPRLQHVAALSQTMKSALLQCLSCPWVKDVRVMGAIGVIELDAIKDRSALQQRLIDAGVWVRPFGNVVYLTPAFTIDDRALRDLLDAVVAVVCAERP